MSSEASSADSQSEVATRHFVAPHTNTVITSRKKTFNRGCIRFTNAVVKPR